MGRDRRRKRLLVDSKLQLGMSLHIVGFVYVYLVLFALIANFTALKTVVFGGSEAAYVEAVDRLRIFVQVFVLPLVGTMVAMCLHGLVFSHRVVGPIYRFRETMRKVRSGDLAGDIQVRKDDYFGDLCDDVNAMIGHLRGDIIQFREASHELAEQGEALAESGHLPPEDQVKLLQITNASTRLRQLADGYRLQPGEGAPEPDREVHVTEGASA